jgi:endonuclease/exonuclease/phosphatase family metal-dependent hydrolase
VEALFDGQETGAEYDEYRGSENWNQAKYDGRLTAIADAVGKMGGPDVLALEEIETPSILIDLMQRTEGYRYSFFGANPGAALGLGIISRLPFIMTRTHSAAAGGETAPRPVLELWLEHEGLPLVIFVCHWKSKLGGDEATEGIRRASARIIMRRRAEIEGEFPGTPVLILGDLNDNHDEFYRQEGAYLCALLPDDPRAAAMVQAEWLQGNRGSGAFAEQADFLLISSKKPPLTEFFPSGLTAFYSPWTGEPEQGSYYYRETWETIDHVLLSPEWFNGEGLEFLGFQVINGGPFTDASGQPAAYNPRTGYGLSDHLPLLLTISDSPEP